MRKQKLIIGDLLYKVEKLRSENRDLLSIEDVKVLDECVQTLRDLKERDPTEGSGEALGQAMKIIIHLFRFFSETDMF